MARMVKLDSFMKEVGRAEGNHISEFTRAFYEGILISAIPASAARKAIQDFTFSNGLTIPTGYTVSVVTKAAHNDPVSKEPGTRAS